MAPLFAFKHIVQPHSGTASPYESSFANNDFSSRAICHLRQASAAIPRSIVARSNTSNSSTIIGAVIGGILGLVVVVVLIYKCCFDYRSALWIPPKNTSYDDSNFGSGLRRRGGGITKPPKAKTKAKAKAKASPRSVSSDGRQTKRAALMLHNNMMGWSVGPGPPKRASRTSVCEQEEDMMWNVNRPTVDD